MTKYKLLQLKLINYVKNLKGDYQDLLKVMIANDLQDIMQSVENTDLPNTKRAKKE